MAGNVWEWVSDDYREWHLLTPELWSRTAEDRGAGTGGPRTMNGITIDGVHCEGFSHCPCASGGRVKITITALVEATVGLTYDAFCHGQA